MKLLYDLYVTQSALYGAGGGGEYSRTVFRRLAAGASAERMGVFYDMAHPLDPDIEDLVREGGFERHQGGTLGEVQTLQGYLHQAKAQ